MVATSMLLLSFLLGAEGPGLAPRRVLLVAPRDTASLEVRERFAQFAADLSAQPGLVVVVPRRASHEAAEETDRQVRTEGERVFKRAQEAYRRLDLEEALRVLQSLENSRLIELGCPRRIELASRLSFWMGVVLAARKDGPRAAERFATVLSIDGATSIDAGYFPPATVALFEQARRNVGATPRGGISIAVEPRGGLVSLDGKLVEQAPVTLTASEGDHFVCVQRLGWKDWAARLHLGAGRVETQRVFLQRASPEEVVDQVGDLAGRLEDTAAVQALGEAFAAELVLELDGPTGVSWREVTEPARPQHFEGASGSSGERLARELAAVLRAPPPEPPATLPRGEGRASFFVELTTAGGFALGLGSGAFLGGHLAFWWNPGASWSFGARVGLAKGLGSLELHLPSATATAVARAGDGTELEGSLGVRWRPLEGERLRLAVELGALVRRLTWNSPSVVSPPPTTVPFTVLLPQAPSSVLALALGPHVRAAGSYRLGPSLALLAELGYGLEWAVLAPSVTADVLSRPPSGAPAKTQLLAASWRHGPTVGLGMQLGF